MTAASAAREHPRGASDPYPAVPPPERLCLCGGPPPARAGSGEHRSRGAGGARIRGGLPGRGSAGPALPAGARAAPAEAVRAVEGGVPRLPARGSGGGAERGGHAAARGAERADRGAAQEGAGRGARESAAGEEEEGAQAGARAAAGAERDGVGGGGGGEAELESGRDPDPDPNPDLDLDPDPDPDLDPDPDPASTSARGGAEIGRFPPVRWTALRRRCIPPSYPGRRPRISAPERPVRGLSARPDPFRPPGPGRGGRSRAGEWGSCSGARTHSSGCRHG